MKIRVYKYFSALSFRDDFNRRSLLIIVNVDEGSVFYSPYKTKGCLSVRRILSIKNKIKDSNKALGGIYIEI